MLMHDTYAILRIAAMIYRTEHFVGEKVIEYLNRNARKLSPFVAVGMAICFLLTGCTTPYGPVTGTDSRHVAGYSERQIDSNIFEVSFTGLAGTGQGVIHRYAIYHAAEIAKAKGYTYFTVLHDTMGILRSGYKNQYARYRCVKVVRFQQERTIEYGRSIYTVTDVLARSPGETQQ